MKAKVYTEGKTEPKKVINVHKSDKAKYHIKSGSDGFHVNSKPALIELFEKLHKAIIEKGGRVELE